jgi:hypothetical protein
VLCPLKTNAELSQARPLSGNMPMLTYRLYTYVSHVSSLCNHLTSVLCPTVNLSFLIFAIHVTPYTALIVAIFHFNIFRCLRTLLV